MKLINRIYKTDIVEDIKIYQSPLRMILLTLGSFALVASALFLFHHNHTINHIDAIILWIGIAFFGLGGLILLYNTFKKILRAEPFLTITADRVICRGVRPLVVKFADVKSFALKKVENQELIAIHYKPNVESQKMDETSFVGRIIRFFNKQVIDAQDTLSAVGTNMKAQELCDLLNERLEVHNRCKQ